MTFVVKPSRPGSIVAEAFRLKAVDERRMARIKKTYRAKPIAEPEPSKPKPQRAAKKKGTK